MPSVFSSIRVFLNADDSKSNKANVSFKVADVWFVTGARVVLGGKGLFVSMPSNKDLAGKYFDITFPASKEVRDELQALVLKAYADALAKKVPEVPKA